MSTQFRATIREWEKITGMQILDPDGFNRRDRRLHERLFTYDEFIHGSMTSTIQRPKYEPLGDRLLDPPEGILPQEQPNI